MKNLRNIFLISLLCVISLFTSASFADPETANISVVKENENASAAEPKSEITASEENSESEEAKKNKQVITLKPKSSTDSNLSVEQKNRPATMRIAPHERIKARREIVIHAGPKPDSPMEQSSHVQSSNVSAPAVLQQPDHIQVSRSDDIDSVVPFRLGKKNVQRSHSDERDRQISSESIRTRIVHDQELQDRERDIIARERELRTREIEADLRTIRMREDKLRARQIQDGDLRVQEIREADLRDRENGIRNRALSVRQSELDIRTGELRARELRNNELRVREWRDIKSRDQMFRYLQFRDKELRRVIWHDDRGRVCYYLTTYKKVTRVNKRVTVCKWINGVYTCYHPKRYFIFPVTREVCYWIR